MAAVSESLVARHPDVLPLLTERPQRAKLLDAMVAAVGEQGYAATTVADAVRRARVSRGAFYAEFASKEECFAEGFRLGCDVLEEQVARAVRSAADWREELRFGLRAYLRSLHDDPRWARVYLLEAHAIPDARDAGARRFAARYARSFARSGRPVPPDDALYLLSIGVVEAAGCALRAGRDMRELEAVVVGCALRLVTNGEDIPAWATAADQR
jgi:AcrR family transcriptional regulator